MGTDWIFSICLSGEGVLAILSYVSLDFSSIGESLYVLRREA